MIYYKNKDKYLCSLEDSYPYERTDSIENAKDLYYLYRSDKAASKASYAIGACEDLFRPKESLEMLRKKEGSRDKETLPQEVQDLIKKGRVKAVNTEFADYEERLFMEANKKKRVNLLALGDVGSTLLMGLKLLGGDVIDTIGIYDRGQDKLQRWEYEANQISEAFDFFSMAEVEIINDKEDLFDCDMFVFCASKGVPPVGTKGIDMRMVQFEENARLIKEYALRAAAKSFKGIFAVVSDPVDLLCAVVLKEAGGALAPEQIKGYGLGVMNARAAYYAKRDKKYSQYLTEGRAFGPHGKDLVIADSIKNYSDDLSLELTKLAVEANLRVRETGYKPYVAPALSSGAISIIATLRGEWHYSANYLAGAYLGSKNRNLPNGLEIEKICMDDKLFRRIQKTHEALLAVPLP